MLKTTEANRHYGPCEDILISGCTLISTSAAIKIGTESVCDFRDIVISNCSIYDSNRGISFQLRDEGNVENVIISNCIIRTRQASSCWWGCGEPINIASINRKAEIPSGRIRKLTITNVLCRGEGSIYIAGKPETPLEDLTLENIRHELVKTSKYPIKGYDFRPCCGPDFQEGPIHGVYVRNAKDACIKNVSVKLDSSMEPYVDSLINYENTEICQ